MQKLKLLLILFFFVLFQVCGEKNNQFELQTGDLLFSIGKGNSELLVAIQVSTGEDMDIPFTHVGIVSVENDKTYVLEATSPEGVVKTGLEEFFEKTAVIDDKHLIIVGRVIKEFDYIIPNAIKNAEKHLGKRYDYAYDETNNQFYCSELVRFSFLDSLDNPIFEPIPMTFKNPETDTIDSYWIKHFEKLGKTVPEGKPGTNPVDMTKSPVIEIVYKYC